MSIVLDDIYLSKFIKDEEYKAILPQLSTVHKSLNSKTGLGNEFLGWLDLPNNYDKEEFIKIKNVADKIKNNSDVFIVIGIGGSYLGSKAIIEFLNSSYYNLKNKNTPNIYFVGNGISSSDLSEVIDLCKDKDISINMISKSGTTTEPAIAFRIFKDILEKKYGKEEAKNRIYCTTDKEKGTLKKLAEKEGYETFVIPDNIGGRYSVLTSVGLLPIAVCGINIDELIQGALEAKEELNNPDINKNDCYKYAAIRNILYRKGKLIEVLTSFEPSFSLMAEWWKQLFGESEGKDQKGLFPTSAIFSTDLHSMGQLIQDGRRNLFETVVLVEKAKRDIFIKHDDKNVDGLNFLEGKSMQYVNNKAFLGTVIAHTDGNVPNIILKIKERTEKEIGYLIYFFEKACAISGYLLGVNPFNQPGVESYKNNMFALLSKPGYENQKAILQNRLNKNC